MNEIRSFASLSSSLLARKGAAKPAMRPRPLSHEAMLDDLGWNDMGDEPSDPSGHVPSSIAALTPAPKSHAREEHVRDDHADEEQAHDEPAHEEHVREDAEPVLAQQRALVERFGDPETHDQPVLPEAVVTALRVPPAKAIREKAGVAAGRKAAFTLRLDAERHLRLRLAVAVTGQSAQQLVTASLDQFLESIPEVGTMAQHVPARTAKKS